jgi:nitrite reductase/ring-hydroxylating ferredoxin subunit
LLSLGVLVLLSNSCKKENLNEQLGIPYFKVDQYLLLNNPSNIGLNAVGGFVILNGGSRGILVYHRSYNEYVAFDRHCTWQTQQTCGQVSPDSSSTVILNCGCCASKFSMIDGSVLNAPATRPLLQYNAQLSDAATLHIYN